MQILLSPAARSGLFPTAPPRTTPTRPSAYHLPLRSIPACQVPNLPLSHSSPLNHRGSKISLAIAVRATSSPDSQSPPPRSEAEKAQLLQISKRLESTARNFKRLGSLGFWGQLVCTVVAAVILSFLVVITGKISSPSTTASLSLYFSFSGSLL